MVCDYCKKEISELRWKNGVKKYKQLKHVFCDRKCYQEWWKLNVSNKFKGEGNINWKGGETENTCIVCKKEFKVLPYRKEQNFCSHACSAKFHFTGKKN